MKRIRLDSGIGLPFYPMRPTPGAVACEAQLEKDLANGWVIQQKLDGDRVILGVTADDLVFTNRHLDAYSFQIKNAQKFKGLAAGTCLDGECWKGNFYPFEALAIGRVSLLADPVERRIEAARNICQQNGIPWLFEPISAGWVKSHLKVPELEGYVKKRAGSRYEILGTQQDSGLWSKCKWR
jgi:hypothetical protein